MSTPPSKLIYVCISCDRHAHTKLPISAGKTLAANIACHLERHPESGLRVREVACLNGCLKPCNVAFRGTRRPTVRLNRLDSEDIPALVAFGQDYWAMGEELSISIPAAHQLARKVSIIVPPIFLSGKTVR